LDLLLQDVLGLAPDVVLGFKGSKAVVLGEGLGDVPVAEFVGGVSPDQALEVRRGGRTVEERMRRTGGSRRQEAGEGSNFEGTPSALLRRQIAVSGGRLRWGWLGRGHLDQRGASGALF
jgi:hypothetical protein